MTKLCYTQHYKLKMYKTLQKFSLSITMSYFSEHKILKKDFISLFGISPSSALQTPFFRLNIIFLNYKLINRRSGKNY